MFPNFTRGPTRALARGSAVFYCRAKIFYYFGGVTPRCALASLVPGSVRPRYMLCRIRADTSHAHAFHADISGRM